MFKRDHQNKDSVTYYSYVYYIKTSKDFIAKRYVNHDLVDVFTIIY